MLPTDSNEQPIPSKLDSTAGTHQEPESVWVQARELGAAVVEGLGLAAESVLEIAADLLSDN